MGKFFTRQRVHYFLSGVGVLFLFVCFSYLVHKNLFAHSDFDMTVRLQDRIPRRLDEMFSLLSDIGKFEIVSILLLIVIVVYRKVLLGMSVFIAYGSFHLLEIYGKTFVSHLPPPHFMLRTHEVLNFPQFYVRLENSYPSGHAARAFFLTTIIGLIIHKSKRLSSNNKRVMYICLLIYDITMCVSRVYLGEHWASDVVGGSILGMAFALMAAIAL